MEIKVEAETVKAITKKDVFVIMVRYAGNYWATSGTYNVQWLLKPFTGVSIMSKFILALLLVSTSALADPWTREDTQRETVFFGIRTFTYLQTYTVAKDGWKGLHEQNKMLGKYPHQDRVTAYFAINSLVHFGVAYILPAEWREGFQYITIGEVGAAAITNHANGIRVKFPLN